MNAHSVFLTHYEFIWELFMKTLYSFLILLMLTSVSYTSATPANTTYFPANGNTLVFVDMQRMQKSQTFKDVTTFLMANPQSKAKIDEFEKGFGINVFRDVNAVSLHMLARANNNPDVLVHVQGTFDQKKVLAGLGQAGALTPVAAGSMTIHQMPNQNKGVIFINPNELLIGETATLKNAVGNQGKFAGILSTLSQRIKGEKDMWVVTHLGQSELAKVKQKNPLLGNFPDFMIQLDLATGLHLQVNAISNADKVAQSTAGLLNQQLTAVKSNPQAMMFMAVLNKIKIVAQTNEVSIDLPLNQQDVNQIKMLAGLLMMGMQKQGAPPAATGAKRPAFPSLKGKNPAGMPKPAVKAPAPKAPVAPKAPATPKAPAPAPVAPTPAK